jgi:hypothetical protein
MDFIFGALGKLDFITVLILMGAAILPGKFLVYASIYLILKGTIFIFMNRDFASYVDFGCGIYLFILSFGLQIPYLHQIVLYWLIQKTALTFLAIAIKIFLYYYQHKESLPRFMRP